MAPRQPRTRRGIVRQVHGELALGVNDLLKFRVLSTYRRIVFREQRKAARRVNTPLSGAGQPR